MSISTWQVLRVPGECERAPENDNYIRNKLRQQDEEEPKPQVQSFFLPVRLKTGLGAPAERAAGETLFLPLSSYSSSLYHARIKLG